MKAGDLYVVESRNASWCEWKYCTGVRPGLDRTAVEDRLVVYAGRHSGEYRVAVFARDDERTSVVSPPVAVCKSAGRSTDRKRKRGNS